MCIDLKITLAKAVENAVSTWVSHTTLDTLEPRENNVKTVLAQDEKLKDYQLHSGEKVLVERLLRLLQSDNRGVVATSLNHYLAACETLTEPHGSRSPSNLQPDTADTAERTFEEQIRETRRGISRARKTLDRIEESTSSNDPAVQPKKRGA